MRKMYFLSVILVSWCLSFAPLNGMMEGESDEGSSSPPAKTKSVDKRSSRDDLQLDSTPILERLSTLEEDNKQLRKQVMALALLLEKNPAHRRIQRVSAEIWFPIGISVFHYICTGDLSTSLAIMSYGISTLMILWARAYKFDDSFYPITRTRSDKKKE